VTSDQIKNDNNLDSQYFWIWLKECAYQLAVMNEQNQSFDESLGSTVSPDSVSALREKCHNCSHHPDAKPGSQDNAKCLYCGRAVYLATFYVMDRRANERTMRPDSQSASIQTQETPK
jgi:hypothetical protein